MAKVRRSSGSPSKQGGSTFLGIVLGLIIGLAIAMVVALFITHTPTPFVSKNGTSTPSNTSANQPGFDPNRALAGKSPGQPVPPAQLAPLNTAPGQSTQSSDMLDEPQIVELPPSVTPAPSAGRTQPPATKSASHASPGIPAPQPAQPNSTTAHAAPHTGLETPQAKPAVDAANTNYFLQAGAYKTQQDAEQQRARLALQGFESKVTQRNASGIIYYRVRIGPFSKLDDMNSTRQRLSDAGVDTTVIRFTK